MPQQPLWQCRERVLGTVLADPCVAPWPTLPAIPLHDNLSGQPPRHAAWVKAAWTPETLRLLCFAEAPAPASVPDEWELLLDPVGDLEAFFSFRIAPENTVRSAVFRRTRGGFKKNLAWTCAGLQTATRRQETGWCAELSIPLASLAADPPNPYCPHWRVNFFHTLRPGESSAGSPTRFGILEFTR